MKSSRGRLAATPRPRTWIFRGDKSRRRRADIPRTGRRPQVPLDVRVAVRLGAAAVRLRVGAVPALARGRARPTPRAPRGPGPCGNRSEVASTPWTVRGPRCLVFAIKCPTDDPCCGRGVDATRQAGLRTRWLPPQVPGRRRVLLVNAKECTTSYKPFKPDDLAPLTQRGCPDVTWKDLEKEK